MTLLRLLSLLILPLLALPARAEQRPVILLEVEGAIGPASKDFVLRGLRTAQDKGAPAAILRLDTPGGLDSSMRDIIRAMLASKIPVVVYVAPSGARAASAGTYILYASHVAAMAPATNLGSATPVQIGGLPLPGSDEPKPEPGKQPDAKPPDQADKKPDEKPAEPAAKEPTAKPAARPKSAMENKIVNDARAYLRGLAQLRGRNVEWADSAVTEGASLSADEALARGVIDLVAADVADLLRKLNGRAVKVEGKEQVLNTAGGVVEVIAPDWRNQLLAVITNPQVAYILMLLGVYGLFFELSSPGSVVPGVLGGICLLLALFAFQVLPVNYAGLGLLILGLLFMIGEAFMPSFGILGLGGIVAFVVGSLILWDETGPGHDIPLGMIVGFALASALLLIGLGAMLARQRRRPTVTGDSDLAATTGVVLEDFAGEGWVRVRGETWRARGDRPLKKGDPVRISRREGLILSVQPTDEVPHD